MRLLFPGCPHDWIAGPAACYQIPRNMVTRREFAVNKCAARGGHLVTIETEEENHFLSQVFWNESQGTHIHICVTEIERNASYHIPLDI